MPYSCRKRPMDSRKSFTYDELTKEIILDTISIVLVNNRTVFVTGTNDF